MTEEQILVHKEGSPLKPYILFMSIFLLSAPSFFIPTSSSAESWRDDIPAEGKFVFSGSLGINYEHEWFQQGSPTYRLGETLNLDFRSFVVDRKLFTYHISGLVLNETGSGTSSTLKGLGFNATLFRSLPRGLDNGESKYIPHPIWLRFNRLTGEDTDYTNYGFSFMHAIPQEKLLVVTEVKEEERDKDADLYEEGPSRTVKTAEKRTAPFPVTFFDYDHFNFSSLGSSSASDMYNLRSSLTGDVYNYRFLYTQQNQTGDTESKSSTIEFRPDYHFYDEGTRRILNVSNLLKYDTLSSAGSDANDLFLQNGVNWIRPFGRDILSLATGAGYFRSDVEGVVARNYNAALSGAYKKYIVPWNSATLSAAFTKSDGSDSHAARLSDTSSANWGLFAGSAGAFVGNSDTSVDYGVNSYLRMNTRLSVFLGYSYSSLSAIASVLQQEPTTAVQVPSSRERRTGHNATLGVAGPLANNLSFSTSSVYSLVDVSDGTNPRSEKSFVTSGNLFWRLGETNITFGGSESSVQSDSSQRSFSGSFTSLYATLSRNLMRRMFLSLYSTWTRDHTTGLTTLEVKPHVTWSRGRTTVEVEYDYLKSETPGSPAAENQRIFVNLRRYFGFVR